VKNQDTSPHSIMMQHILAQWIGRPIGLVARLGVPDLLASGVMSVGDLAAATGTHEASLYRILRALAGVGIFHEDEEMQFSLTPLGECLTSDHLRYQAMLFSSVWHDRAWSELDHAVMTGEAAFNKAFGKPTFEWLAENPEDARIHALAMASNLEPRTKAIVESFRFDRYGMVVDVGAGNGALVAAIAARNPGIRGIAADLPHVIAQAELTFASADLSDRCRAEPCDFMESVPAGGGVYILSNVLHDWDDSTCRRILHNCRDAMGQGSRLLIVEFLIPPANVFSPAKLLDIEMLVMSGEGRERTKDEFRSLLDTAGLRIEAITSMVTGESLLETAIGDSEVFQRRVEGLGHG
jgi:hypothetical protein